MGAEIREAVLDGGLTEALLALSARWEAENSCYGYRRNSSADLEGRRIFTAVKDGALVGYLFGVMERSKRMGSVMPENTPCFEVEEIYVTPALRSAGIGSALFRFAEDRIRPEAAYITLNAAARNFRPLLRFYIEELGMELWSARLYKRLS